MAKVLEELVVVKISRIIKDSEKANSVVSSEQKKLIEDTLPALIEELIQDEKIIVEVAEIES